MNQRAAGAMETVLALDSAGKTAGVAVWNNGTLQYESYLATGHTHSETLLALCDAAFAATKLTPADIGLLAVTAGPGSFTGLRIGLALAKGLALPFGTPCAPVSTLHALACSAAGDGLVACALDARRGEVYSALFLRAGGVVVRLTPDSTAAAAAFAEQARQTAAAQGCPEIICLGDGAHLVTQTVPENSSVSFTLYPEARRFGRAGGICQAALQLWAEGGCTDAHSLVPAYHRLSQAERERAARAGNAQPADADKERTLL